MIETPVKYSKRTSNAIIAEALEMYFGNDLPIVYIASEMGLHSATVGLWISLHGFGTKKGETVTIVLESRV